MKMLQKLRYLFTVGLLMALLFASCQDDEITTDAGKNALRESDKRYDMLARNGFDMKDATLVKEGVLLEGDIVIPFEAFEMHQNPNGRVQQYHVGNTLLITQPNAAIEVFIDGATFTNAAIRTNLTTAVNSAVADYNRFCAFINMSVTTVRANAELIITSGTLGAGNFGRAVFPVNGRIGTGITVDEASLQASSVTTVSGLRRVISHEIGHCLGLRHSDWNQTISHTEKRGIWPFRYTVTIIDHNPEPQTVFDPTISQTVDALLIAGTPQSDPNSIMNRLKHNEPIVFNGFSAFDQLAVETLYPNPTSCIPLSVSLTGGSSNFVCQSTSVPLMANVTGGEGPYTYNWIIDYCSQKVDVPSGTTTTNVSNFVGYLWYTNGGPCVNGASQFSYSVRVTVTSSNGLTATSNSRTLFFTTTCP